MDRGALEVDTLVKIVLVLVVVWLVLEVMQGIMRLTFGMFRFLSPLVGLLVVILLVLWLLDRI